MLSRRHYRIKVLQFLYSFFQGGEPRIEVAEKNLLKSVEMISQLFCLEFSFLFELVHFYRYRMEEAKNKFLPTEEELNPSTKLPDNRLLALLAGNVTLQKQISRFSISWTEEQELVRKTYLKMKSSKDLLNYLASGENSFEEDRKFLIRFFRKQIANNADLISYCEEKSIHWVTDFDIASGFALKALMIVPENYPKEEELSRLFTRENEEEAAESIDFLKKLFSLTIIHSEKFDRLIGERTRNWELERIALTDIILLKMALSELMDFPQIPVKVTLNEYIEISKHFSTQKSKQFINGILDRLVSDLREQDLIKKTGRGLVQ